MRMPLYLLRSKWTDKSVFVNRYDASYRMFREIFPQKKKRERKSERIYSMMKSTLSQYTSIIIYIVPFKVSDAENMQFYSMLNIFSLLSNTKSRNNFEWQRGKIRKTKNMYIVSCVSVNGNCGYHPDFFNPNNKWNIDNHTNPHTPASAPAPQLRNGSTQWIGIGFASNKTMNTNFSIDFNLQILSGNHLSGIFVCILSEKQKRKEEMENLLIKPKRKSWKWNFVSPIGVQRSVVHSS